MLVLVVLFLGLVAIFKNEIVKIGQTVIRWHKEQIRYTTEYKFSRWFIGYMEIIGIDKKVIQRYDECRNYERQSVIKSLLCMFGIITLYSFGCMYDYKGIKVKIWKFGKWDGRKDSLEKIASENKDKFEAKAKELFPDDWEHYTNPNEVFIPGSNLVDLWF